MNVEYLRLNAQHSHKCCFGLNFFHFNRLLYVFNRYNTIRIKKIRRQNSQAKFEMKVTFRTFLQRVLTYPLLLPLIMVCASVENNEIILDFFYWIRGFPHGYLKGQQKLLYTMVSRLTFRLMKILLSTMYGYMMSYHFPQEYFVS